ncbi:MAG: hypothetical protein KHY44_10155 [Clostridiales bacterium]|nr:hypothetical protein [Clostridiales bacterium]
MSIRNGGKNANEADLHFYTSINNNYLPKARVLAKTIKHFCPNAKFSLVLCDELPKEVDVQQEPFDCVLTVQELGIPTENLDFWIYTHTVVELCTAVKGQALVKLLEEGAKKVIYLDPDIAVFNNLQEINNLLDKYDVLLTPHQTSPENTKEDVVANEICSLMHGTYNFGFYAVKNSENGLKFAKWWRDRLVDFCFDDIPNGLFTDQKWGDLVPALFEGVYILKDPGCNVCTWNLSNREVTKDENGMYFVNGHPLKFYHFSGFDSGAQANMLEKYGKGNVYLYELRDWYQERLNVEGQSKYGKFSSKYNFYNNGTKILDKQRIFLRKRVDLVDYFKNTNPYIIDQEKSYYKWFINEELQLGKEIIVDEIGMRAQLENELNTIYASRSWKLVQVMKKTKSMFRR